MTPQSLGGLAVKGKPFPLRCPRCGVSLAEKTYHGYLGHLGMHGYADRYFGGHLSQAAQQLAYNAMAAYDPAPWNGVWARRKKTAKIYKPKGATMITDFSKIQFNADKHSYFYDGKELTGVTKYLKRFQKPFDQWANAQRVAQRESRTVSSVLAEWEAKGEKSRVLGTAVHQHIQDILKENHNGQIGFDNFLDLNTKAPEINAFDALWGQLQPKVSYCREHVEFVVGDAELGIAGTVDTMLFSPETGLYHIWDWKTGKFDLTNQWGTLLPPFDYLDDAKFNLYSLQTSLYRLIIERNTGLKLGDSYLVHLSDPSTGYKIHRAVDLRERLLDCLEIPFLA